MKIFNKYTYLFLGLIIIASIVVLNFIPDLETEEFDQEVIDDIIEGVTTTTISNVESTISSDDEMVIDLDDEIIIPEEQIDKINEILLNNAAENEITGFDAYLLIGSDERSEKIAETRGNIQGKRADVIILGFLIIFPFTTNFAL